MSRDLDRHAGTTEATEGNPEAKWLIWAMWSGISLLAALFVVFVGGFDTGLLLGWAVGIIIAAMLMVFRR